MSAIDDALINDARALLAAFSASDAKSLTLDLRDAVRLKLNREAVVADSGRVIRAPHVATVLRLPKEDADVGDGTAVIVLSVLDDELTIEIDGKGVVEQVFAKIDDLVEFGSPLVLIQDS